MKQRGLDLSASLLHQALVVGDHNDSVDRACRNKYSRYWNQHMNEQQEYRVQRLRGLRIRNTQGRSQQRIYRKESAVSNPEHVGQRNVVGHEQTIFHSCIENFIALFKLVLQLFRHLRPVKIRYFILRTPRYRSGYLQLFIYITTIEKITGAIDGRKVAFQPSAVIHPRGPATAR
jgi:hypothetical protein